MDRTELKGQLTNLRKRKEMCVKKLDFRSAQEIQDKINKILVELKGTRVTDGGNMYETSVDWI
jgi:hypothetical protein